MSAPETPGIPQPGEVLAGRYRITSLLGRGGGGVVYRAQQLGIQRDVAIKILPPDSQLHPAAVRRFEREARLVSRLRHPNTVTLYEFSRTESGILFIVMEYVEGVSLKAVLKSDGQIPPQRTVPIVRQILKSLSEAHSLGIVHRDLKPGNIMLCTMHGERDFVKVLDFGVATVLGAEDAEEEDDVTRTADVVGTPKYMAPEQFRSDQLTPASDLYSVACLAFEMLAGYSPFDGETLHVTIARHLFQPPPELPEGLRGFPNLVEVVERLLMKQPEDRFQRAEEVVEALAGWDKGATRETTRPDAVPQGLDYAARRHEYPEPLPAIDRTPNPGALAELPKSGDLPVLGEDSARYSQQQVSPYMAPVSSTPSFPIYGSSDSVISDTDPSMAAIDGVSVSDSRKSILVVMVVAAVMLAGLAAAILMLRSPAARGGDEGSKAGKATPATTSPGTPLQPENSIPTLDDEPVVGEAVTGAVLEAALTAHFAHEPLEASAVGSLVMGAYARPKPATTTTSQPAGQAGRQDKTPTVPRVTFNIDYRPKDATIKVRGGSAKCADGVCRVRARLGAKVTVTATAEGRADHKGTIDVIEGVKPAPIRLFPRR